MAMRKPREPRWLLLAGLIACRHALFGFTAISDHCGKLPSGLISAASTIDRWTWSAWRNVCNFDRVCCTAADSPDGRVPAGDHFHNST
jgi:hypothetical protein